MKGNFHVRFGERGGETRRPQGRKVRPAPTLRSGVFLVRAYQRLVAAWQQKYCEFPTAQQLGDILQCSIFGVDINSSAVRIAAFNLYLGMLDYLGDQVMHDESFRFPSLVGTNLLVADFFAPEVKERFANYRFDRVIGNPPWGKNTLTEHASLWLKEHSHTVGRRQIAQGFLLRAPEFCAEDGEVALLAPAKSTILVASGPHEEFRQRFFEEYDVRTVVNFSVLRHELFAESVSPAVAMFYRTEPPSPNRQIAYGVPKPSLISQQLGAIVLDATEVKFLGREELLKNPALWKVALWGTPRDAALIERLRSLPTLQEQAERLEWKISEGIYKGGEKSKKKEASWLLGMRLLTASEFQRYVLDVEACEPIQQPFFHRPHTPDILRGPLALIHQSPVERRCAAAFNAEDIAYTQSFTGIVGQPGQGSLLKWLVAYINSPLAQYYHFLTSSRWAVERANFTQEEYKRMPFLVPNEDDPKLQKVLYHFDQITARLEKHDWLFSKKHEVDIKQHETAIAKLVFDLYGLTSAERQLVRDMVDYGIDFFYWAKKTRRRPGGTRAVQRPDARLLQGYAETFAETVTALLRYQDQTLNAVVYQDDAPLSVVGFELVSLTDARDVQSIEGADTLQETLRHLDHLLLDQRTSTLYMRRHVRIYDGSWLYLVRPSERRFWTHSQARADADSVVIEWLSYSPVQE